MQFAINLRKRWLACLLLSAYSLLPSNAHAQKEKERWLLGAGITYCSYIGNPGANLNVTYRLIGGLHVGPDFSAILNNEEKENGTAVIRKELEYNLNAHYIFELSEKLAVYPLIGINYSKVTIHPEGEEADKRWISACNSGGGVEYSLNKTRLFFESKYVSKLEKYDLTLGILFAL